LIDIISTNERKEKEKKMTMLSLFMLDGAIVDIKVSECWLWHLFISKGRCDSCLEKYLIEWNVILYESRYNQMRAIWLYQPACINSYDKMYIQAVVSSRCIPCYTKQAGSYH